MTWMYNNNFDLYEYKDSWVERNNVVLRDSRHSFIDWLFFSIHFENLLQLHATYYTTYSLLNNTTRTIPWSARCHDNSVAINVNNRYHDKKLKHSYKNTFKYTQISLTNKYLDLFHIVCRASLEQIRSIGSLEYCN